MYRFVLVILFCLTSCQKTEWLDAPPEEYQGTFFQVSEGVIQGYESPLIIKIQDRYFGNGNEVLPIRKVSKSSNFIVIFCGREDKGHLAEYRYELHWTPDNYLYIDEVVSTGYDNQDGRFFLGKFTNNNYLKSQ